MKPITVLNKGNVPTGPFTRAEVEAKLQSGEFSPNDLAFVEGLSQWTPLRDVLAVVDSSAPPPPPVQPPMANAPAAYSYAATMAPPTHLVYAGFWLRFVAIFIDGLIIGIPVLIISIMIGGAYGFTYGMTHPGGKVGLIDADGNLNGAFVLMEIGVGLFSLTARWLYFSLQESSRAQATIGKRVMGIKVIDLAGQRINFGRATGRFFGKLISGMILCIGYIMAGFTERKQALHDMIAGTLVIRE
jgi:uncharacterized RDD family membrane protein YckC